MYARQVVVSDINDREQHPASAIHRHIIAARGGCFQRRLFVNTITSEQLNVG